MAVLEENLYTYLQTKAAVTALVSTRVYPDAAPQTATLPFLVYTRISTVREHKFGSAGTETGLTQSRIQIDCYASTYSGVSALSEQVRLALSGFRGTFGSGFANRISLVDENDLPADPDYGEQIGVRRKTLDFMVWHQETKATF